MTIGKKFLERVLGESQLDEAKKPRSLDRETFDEKLQELGSAADLYLPIDKKTRLMKMYNGGADIKAVSTSTRDAKEWVKKTRAKYEEKGWKFFHYEDNSDSHEILFTKAVVKEQLEEAKKDVDGFKDAFDITTLPPTSPAVANLPMPMAKQVVQLYHLMGVSVETLEMRPKAVKEAAMTVADEMRTNRPLRMAAQRLFSALATAKGFARQEEEVMEASASMTPEKDMQLIGNTIVKQMEAVLAALKLPAGVLQRAMRRDQQAMMETAEIIRSGAARSKFAMLASELGVDLMGVGQSVKVQEGAKMSLAKGVVAGGLAAGMGMPASHAAGLAVGTAVGDYAMGRFGKKKDDRAVVKSDDGKVKVTAPKGSSVTITKEAATMTGPELGQNRAAQAMETLIAALGLENVFNSREAMATRRALPQKMAALRNPTAVYTLIDRLVKELGNTK